MNHILPNRSDAQVPIHGGSLLLHPLRPRRVGFRGLWEHSCSTNGFDVHCRIVHGADLDSRTTQ